MFAKKRAVVSILVGALLLTASASHAASLAYDPEADPFVDYRHAIARAADEHKLVLIIAGGDWCRWCHVLERFIDRNADVQRRLDDTFIVMKAYVGPDNYNEAFFSQLPRALGAPHFWIVSPERKVLASQSTAQLELGRGAYDKNDFLAFIDAWRTRKEDAAQF